MAGLFGEEFEIKIDQPNIKDLVKKVSKTTANDKPVEKVLKSKKLSLEERLSIIKTNVLQTLGKQKDNVLVIRDLDTFSNYISKAISYGRVAIDTETNNSLDPITCNIMGLCLYVPGEKQVYVPIHHINNETGKLLENQCTEEDIKNQLQRIEDTNTFTVFHNYKFDYEVIKCTCGIEVHCNWDTMIAAKLIDENEHSAGLKQQYISKIDKTQEKYSIDHLFENVEYAQVDPEIFGLYGSQDAYMTDKLYLWQKPIMEAYEKENPDCNPYKLFRDVELPVIKVVAEMELQGILFDTEYAKRLRTKFNKKLAVIDEKINEELKKLQPTINSWKLSVPANFRPLKKGKNITVVEKTKKSYTLYETIVHNKKESTKEQDVFDIVRTWMHGDTQISEEEAESLGLDKLINEKERGKSKVEQLEDPISMDSPTQLAILLYDIIGVPVTDKTAPRGTGEEVLNALKSKYPLCEYLLERRSIVKMLDAFINSLPDEVNKKTGKIHCHFNQYGAATGRTSCSGPNLQQIPSHEKSIRLLFRADCPKHQVEIKDNYYEVPASDEVETINGWKSVKELIVGDIIIGQDNKETITKIDIQDSNYLLYV